MWSLDVEQTSLIFDVTACSDAYVTVSETLGALSQSPAYDILIGADGNQATKLMNRTTGDVITSQNTSNILNCSDFRSFWVSWANGFIQIGHGSKVNLEVIPLISRLV